MDLPMLKGYTVILVVVDHFWGDQRLGVTVNLTLGYHAESNGQAEHLIQEISRFLWAYCSNQQHDWA